MAVTMPGDYPKVFGQNFAKRNLGTIVTIGKRQYNKYQLGRMGCPHVTAARTLDRTLKQLNVKSLEDVATKMSPEDFVGLKGFGVTAFYALTCVLRDAGVPLSEFYRSKVTVETLQENVRKSKRRRKAAA